MSIRSPIPSKIREVLSEDPFMKKCIINDCCDGRIEWDHAFTYKGKRVNELWALLPKCHKHHDARSSTSYIITRIFLRKRIYDFDALEDFKKKYPRSDLFHRTNGILIV